MLLPNEILSLIFQHFNSRRHLITCQLVCKKWYYIATDPSFYNSITIYTPTHLEKFMIAATASITTTTLKRHYNKPIGHFVRHLIILFDDYIEDDILKYLKKCCPLLTSLQLPRNFDIVSYKHYHQLGYISNIQLKNDNNSDFTNDDDIVIHYIHDDNNEKGIIVHDLPNDFQFYTYSQQALTELCLQFRDRRFLQKITFRYLNTIHLTCPQLIIFSMVNIYFDIQDENDDNNNVDDHQLLNTSSMTFHPCSSLTNFYVENIVVKHLFFFTYITECYSNVESLEIKKLKLTNPLTSQQQQQQEEDIVINNENEQYDCHAYDQAIINMFITLASLRLTHFKLTFSSSSEHNFQSCNDLLEWIYHHHTDIHLKKFSWSYGILPLQRRTLDNGIYNSNDNYNNNNNNNNNHIEYLHYINPFAYQILGFLHQLHTLTFQLTDTTWDILESILNETNLKVLSPHLKSLSLLPINGAVKETSMPLFDWLDLFPTLTTLEISRLNVYTTIQTQKENDKHPLQRLMMVNCELQEENALSRICHYCPRLIILHCIRNSLFYPQLFNASIQQEGKGKEKEKDEKNEDENHLRIYHHTLLHAPHHQLKELKMDNLYYFFEDNGIDFPHDVDLQLNTSSFTISKRNLIPCKGNTYGSHTHTQKKQKKLMFRMIIKLKTLDRFYFNGSWAYY